MPLNFSLGPDGGRVDVDQIEQAIPGILESGFAAAGTPNVAGGGATDFFRGVSVGNQRVNQIKTEHAQRALLERQLDMEDVGVQQKLMASGRPVIGGMVEEDQMMPDIPGSIIPGGGTVKVPRPVDNKRLVKYKMRNGQEVQVELYTPDELFKQEQQRKEQELRQASQFAVNQAGQIADIQQKKAAAARQAELQQRGITIPEGFPGAGQLALPGELNEIIVAQSAINKASKEAPDKFEHWTTDAEGNVYGYRESGDVVDFGPRGQGKEPKTLTVPEIAAKATDPTLTPAQRNRWQATLDAIKKSDPAKVDQLTQTERQAKLIEKRNNGTITPQETNELKSIEEARGFIPAQYGAGFKQMTTPEGKTIWVHPGTNEVRNAPPDTRPAYTAGEREKVSTLDDIVTMADRVEVLANKYKDVIGPVSGRWTEVKRWTFPEKDEINELFRLTQALKNEELYTKSGAAINESEAKRIAAIMPEPKAPIGKFLTDLRSQRRFIVSKRGKLSGQKPLITPGTTGAPAPEAQGAGGSGTAAVNAPPPEVIANVPEGKTFRGPDGTRWIKQGGKAVPVQQ